MRRNKLEMTIDFLRNCSPHEFKPISHICWGAGVNVGVAKAHIIPKLVENNMISEDKRVKRTRPLSNSPKGKVRYYYKLTKEGANIVKQFDSIKKQLELGVK